MHTASRYHDFCAGHRVVEHESKCQHLHGHNYRVHFEVTAAEQLDSLGRVIDFSVIKTLLCDWLEQHWDHKMLIWEHDPFASHLLELDGRGTLGITLVPFNPTAENMAEYLASAVAPFQLAGTGVWLTSVVIEETRKCSVRFTPGVTMVEGTAEQIEVLRPTHYPSGTGEVQDG